MVGSKKFWKKLAYLSVFLGNSAYSTEISIEQVIRYAVERHPVIEAGQYSEMSQRQSEKMAQSAYYPSMSAQALETVGFPGSSAATGVEGLMISPFHKSPSAGFVLRQNIWDFGRTAEAVRLAEKETDLSKKNNVVTRLRVSQAAQEVYFLCSKDRSLAEVHFRIASESEIIQKEVENFVRVGQRSVVDNYLSKSQTEEAKTVAEDFKKRFELDNQRLAHLTGQDGKNPLCPLLDEKTIQALKSSAISTTSVSPLLDVAAAQTAISQTQKSLAKKDFNPKIVGIASVGWMNGTELGVQKQYYSAAIAVILPLFEGFKTSSEVRKHELSTIQNEKNLDATRFGIDEANLNFDRAIESARIRTTRLKSELEIAETGFATAKKRYFDLQGTLVDLREATRNLARTSGELKVAYYELATQSTGKSLLNGEWNQVIQADSAKTQKRE